MDPSLAGSSSSRERLDESKALQREEKDRPRSPISGEHIERGSFVTEEAHEPGVTVRHNQQDALCALIREEIASALVSAKNSCATPQTQSLRHQAPVILSPLSPLSGDDFTQSATHDPEFSRAAATAS
eukprot:Seg2844.4 transcript_id=Seg2844.4/GoldUCD/mRNA.D3Y31 product="hypothetical protein" protein_id=Seg2844.4/GoldUCD/D3Y31